MKSCSLRYQYYCFSPSARVFRSVSAASPGRRRPQSVKSCCRTGEDTIKCHHQGDHHVARLLCIRWVLIKILAAGTLNCKYLTMKRCISSQAMGPRYLYFAACPHLRGQQEPAPVLVCSSTRTIPMVNHPPLIRLSAN